MKPRCYVVGNDVASSMITGDILVLNEMSFIVFMNEQQMTTPWRSHRRPEHHNGNGETLVSVTTHSKLTNQLNLSRQQ